MNHVGEVLPRTRLVRLITTISLTATLLGFGTACGTSACPLGTATFPIVGVVVKKERLGQNCYMLHVKREDNLRVQTVRVKYFRYAHVNVQQNVKYSEQPTN